MHVIKSTWGELKINIIEEKVNELEDIKGETIQRETQKENKNLQF